MKIEVNVDKKIALIVLGMMFLLLGGVVYAYGTSSPSTFGHSAGEIDLSGALQTTIVSNSKQSKSPRMCCPSGYVRTGCGESGDSNAYSYPTSGECCSSWFDGDGTVYAICTKFG